MRTAIHQKRACNAYSRRVRSQGVREGGGHEGTRSECSEQTNLSHRYFIYDLPRLVADVSYSPLNLLPPPRLHCCGSIMLLLRNDLREAVEKHKKRLFHFTERQWDELAQRLAESKNLPMVEVSGGWSTINLSAAQLQAWVGQASWLGPGGAGGGGRGGERWRGGGSACEPTCG